MHYSMGLYPYLLIPQTLSLCTIKKTLPLKSTAESRSKKVFLGHSKDAKQDASCAVSGIVASI
jgi:hypothetical protein